jgi:excisionase family DNA binding protein
MTRLAYGVSEAAELVGLSENTIRRLVDAGILASVPDTGRVLIAHAELERWVTSTMKAAS